MQIFSWAHEAAQAFVRSYTTMHFKSENMFLKDKGQCSMLANAVNKGRRCLILSNGIVQNSHVQKIGNKGATFKTADKDSYILR